MQSPLYTNCHVTNTYKERCHNKSAKLCGCVQSSTCKRAEIPEDMALYFGDIMHFI